MIKKTRLSYMDTREHQLKYKNMKQPTFRQIADQVAKTTDAILKMTGHETLDRNQTEEISLMIQEGLNRLNGNIETNDE